MFNIHFLKKVSLFKDLKYACKFLVFELESSYVSFKNETAVNIVTPNTETHPPTGPSSQAK